MYVNDSPSYTGSCIATSSASHARQLVVRNQMKKQPISPTVIDFSPNIFWHLWCYFSNSCSHYMSEHIYTDHLPNRPVHGTLDITLQEKVV